MAPFRFKFDPGNRCPHQDKRFNGSSIFVCPVVPLGRDPRREWGVLTPDVRVATARLSFWNSEFHVTGVAGEPKPDRAHLPADAGGHRGWHLVAGSAHPPSRTGRYAWGFTATGQPCTAFAEASGPGGGIRPQRH